MKMSSLQSLMCRGEQLWAVRTCFLCECRPGYYNCRVRAVGKSAGHISESILKGTGESEVASARGAFYVQIRLSAPTMELAAPTEIHL